MVWRNEGGIKPDIWKTISLDSQLIQITLDQEDANQFKRYFQYGQYGQEADTREPVTVPDMLHFRVETKECHELYGKAGKSQISSIIPDGSLEQGDGWIDLKYLTLFETSSLI